MSLQQLSAFSSFVDELKALYEEYLANRCTRGEELLDIDRALDGGASSKLKELVSSSVLKKQSAFFTGQELANRLASEIIDDLESKDGAVVADPACGAGDLLIAAASYLPTSDSLEETLERWSKRLKGFEQSQPFIESTKYRLALLALKRGSRPERSLPDPQEYFSQIRKVEDSLSESNWPDCDYILLNPPFSKVQAPDATDWATGEVSQAGLFLIRALETSPPPKGVLAILPDVLRSGARYRRWREQVEQRAILKKIRPIGKFDSTTDVDVFGTHLNLGSSSSTEISERWWPDTEVADRRLEDFFDLQVGSVVPHRNPETGDKTAFVDASALPAWGTLNASDAEKRAYDRPTVDPPFVTVRRTSSPSDPHRAVGTVVTGDQPVAVENHLVVLVPQNGTLERCRELVTRLRDERTDDWLNTRIRCRHLTISSLEKLPWWEL